MCKIKIKLLMFAISSLFIMPAYAFEASMSTEQLIAQIMLQKEQIDILSKKVRDLEDLVFLIAKLFEKVDKAFQNIDKRVREAEIVSITTLVSLTLVSSLAILAMKERVAWS